MMNSNWTQKEHRDDAEGTRRSRHRTSNTSGKNLRKERARQTGTRQKKAPGGTSQAHANNAAKPNRRRPADECFRNKSDNPQKRRKSCCKNTSARRPRKRKTEPKCNSPPTLQNQSEGRRCNRPPSKKPPRQIVERPSTNDAKKLN